MPEACRFSKALVRRPGASVVHGLRAVDRGAPTHSGVLSEWEAYVGALGKAGLEVETLPALEDFPDSVFVEDTALVFPEGAIVLRPGAPSRFAEAAQMAPALTRQFEQVLTLSEGFVEGGDVLTTPKVVMIGLSARTNEKGALAARALLERFNRTAVVVHTPADVLHFKTDCSLVDEETILSTSRLAESGVFDGYRLILTPAGEEAAANSLRVNDRVFVGAAFPRTAELLDAAGLKVEPLRSRQIALLDAGFSCLSLRWQAS